MITLVGFEKCLNKFIGAEFVVDLEQWVVASNYDSGFASSR